MQYEAHRGVSSECPENTMRAFCTAILQGYEAVELDPAFTRDGVCVVFHDAELNRTCRMPDGSELPEHRLLAETTFEELQTYDAGLHKGLKFRGERVPRLAEVLALAAETGILVKIDNRIGKMTEMQLETVLTLCEASGARLAVTCADIALAQRLAKRLPQAEIHYDGPVTEETLNALAAVVPPECLTVWMCLPSPLTDWVKVPRASQEAAAMIHERGMALGIWILETADQLREAEALGAGMIETTGALKPPCEPAVFSCHNHSEYSHDSQTPIAAHCRSFAAAGFDGFALTDHCDVEFCREMDVVTPLFRAADAMEALQTEFPRLKLMTGVEAGESIRFPETAERVIHGRDYDIVLGSVHAITGHPPFGSNPFDQWADDELDAFLQQYFADELATAQTVDIDVLTHLTLPVRYITGKCGRAVDLTRYQTVIGEILRTIIARGIALEVNTSALGLIGQLMPETSILRHYREMGGYLITIGSDAHMTENDTFGIAQAHEMLLAIGFENAYYYQKRVPIPYALKK